MVVIGEIGESMTMVERKRKSEIDKPRMLKHMGMSVIEPK